MVVVGRKNEPRPFEPFRVALASSSIRSLIMRLLSSFGEERRTQGESAKKKDGERRDASRAGARHSHLLVSVDENLLYQLRKTTSRKFKVSFKTQEVTKRTRRRDFDVALSRCETDRFLALYFPQPCSLALIDLKKCTTKQCGGS